MQKFAKEMWTPDAHFNTRLNKAVWAKGIDCLLLYLAGVKQVSRKCNENEESLNKLYTLVTYVPVITLKNVQTVNVGEN